MPFVAFCLVKKYIYIFHTTRQHNSNASIFNINYNFHEQCQLLIIILNKRILYGNRIILCLFNTRGTLQNWRFVLNSNVVVFVFRYMKLSNVKYIGIAQPAEFCHNYFFDKFNFKWMSPPMI